MAATINVLGLILSSYPYLRSVRVWFPILKIVFMFYIFFGAIYLIVILTFTLFPLIEA